MELVIIGGKEAEEKLRDNFTRIMFDITMDYIKEGKIFEPKKNKSAKK